jgi:hypothetical protein
VRHTFGTGEWVELIPLPDLRIKHKKKLLAIGNALVPMTADGEFDPAAVIARYGSWQAYNEAHSSTQFAAVIALTVTAWSCDVPVPSIDDGGVLVNAASADAAPLELEDLLAPYLTRLTREPDPKEVSTAITSSSNGVSPARAKASPRA